MNQPEIPTTSETPTTKESKYKKIVFGHPFSGFDRDQFFSYYIALKAGLVSKDTPKVYIPKPSADDLSEPTALVIEGFSSDQKGKKKGNFTNGENDEPAAFMLFQEHRSEFDQKSELFKKITDLANWVKNVETHEQNPKPLKNLNIENLVPLTELFYAMKYYIQHSEVFSKQEEKQTEFLHRMVQIVDVVIGQSEQIDFDQVFEPILTQYRKKLEEDKTKLTERAKDPTKLKKAESFTGTSLSYFDIRGLNIEKGALEVARQQSQSDVVMLIDNELDEDGNIIGTQIKIQVNNKSNTQVKLDELADRLNTQEALFGKGFEFSQEYTVGGHKGIIGTAQWVGSDLQAEEVWYALQDYFDTERYELSTFETKVKKLAHKAGIKRFSPDLMEPPETPYVFNQRAAKLMVPQKRGGAKQVTVLESDVDLYLAAMSEDEEKNKELLLSSTSVTEPLDILNQREKRNIKLLEKYIAQKDAERLLCVLDDLNTTSLEHIDGKLLLDVFAVIATNPTAISQIWDKDNLRFRIRDRRLPEEITPETESYKSSRYKLDSLAKLIDKGMIRTLREHAVQAGESTQKKFAKAIVSILTSETYLHSHQEQSYDTLLESYLYFLHELKKANEQLGTQLVKELIDSYGKKENNHWRHIHRPYLNTVAASYPEEFKTIIGQLPADKGLSIESLPGGSVDTPNIEKINQKLETLSPEHKYINVLVEIQRPIQASIEQTPFVLRAGGEETRKIQHNVEVDARVYAPTALNFERGDHIQIAEETLKIVRQLITEVLSKDKDSKIRVILGGFPSQLGMSLGVKIGMELSKPDMKAFENRVIISSFNVSEGRFSDTNIL